MPRMQFLMLRAVEDGASLTEATEAALAWTATHSDGDLFERRAYSDWEAVHEGQGNRGDQDDRTSDIGVDLPLPLTPPKASRSATRQANYFDLKKSGRGGA